MRTEKSKLNEDALEYTQDKSKTYKRKHNKIKQSSHREIQSVLVFLSTF